MGVSLAAEVVPKAGDPDVSMRPTTRADGLATYEYVRLYTDDCLVVADDAEGILKG